MVKLGLVGFGNWGRNYLHSIGNVRIAELAAICKRDPSTVPAAVRKSVPVTTSLDQVLRSGAKGVIVATPPSSHREIACFFLERGVPVMLEKPVAETVEDAEAIFEASERFRAPVMVNHIHLFSPSFVHMKRKVESWRLKTIWSEAGADGPLRPYSVLLDWGSHDVAMAMAIHGGSPDGAEIFRVDSDRGELYNVRLYFGDAVSDLNVGNGMVGKARRFEVFCEDGVAVYDDLAEHKLVIDGEPVKAYITPPLDEAVFMFSRCVEIRDTDWRFDPGLALDVMRVLSLPLS